MTEQNGAATAANGSSAAARRGRRVVVVLLVGLGGAALVAISAGVTWWSAEYVDPLTGPLTVTLSGASCLPELVPLALVGLAGLGAALATGGVARRLVGLVLLAAGIAVTARAAFSFGTPPSGLAGSLTRPAQLVGEAQLHALGPALALLGGILLTAAGVLVALGVGARRLGARYDRTAGRRSTGTGDAGALEQGDWWKALDAGTDPTDGAPRTATGSDPEVDGTGGSASEVVGATGGDVGTASATGSATAPGSGSGSDPTLPRTKSGSAGGTVSEQTSADGYDDPQARRQT